MGGCCEASEDLTSKRGIEIDECLYVNVAPCPWHSYSFKA